MLTLVYTDNLEIANVMYASKHTLLQSYLKIFKFIQNSMYNHIL